jgi:hypothetical protein
MSTSGEWLGQEGEDFNHKGNGVYNVEISTNYIWLYNRYQYSPKVMEEGKVRSGTQLIQVPINK